MALFVAVAEGSGMAAAMYWAVLAAHPGALPWSDVPCLLGHALLPAVGCMFGLYYAGLYDFRRVPRYADFLAGLPRALAISLGSIIPAALTDCASGWHLALSRVPILVAALLILRASVYLAMPRLAARERVLVLGAGPLSADIVRRIECRLDRPSVVVGIAANAFTPGSVPLSQKIVGPIAQLGKIIEEVRPDRIIVALAERRGQLPVDALLEARARGIAVDDALDVYERLTGKIAVESLAPSSVIFCRDFGPPRAALILRRAVSLAAAAGGLLVLAPILLAIAAAIKLDSPGPVFFRQRRLGYRGRPFMLIKFRTMRPSDETTSEWVRDNADRITRLGGWLRRFRLDELPQFLNILRGDMNLVGPRPHPMSNVPLFLERIPYYALRTLVRPGITGWAQTRYGYANTLEEETEKMRYDLYYIKHVSMPLDLRILLDTVKVVFLGREAAVAEAVDVLSGRAEEQLRAA
jgi:exopolysaccharide biosynthesis polyprenyl glycosylphosphotransferase